MSKKQLKALEAEGIDVREYPTINSAMAAWREKKHGKYLSQNKLKYLTQPNNLKVSEKDNMSEDEREAWSKLTKTDFSSDAEADFIEAQNKNRK